MRPKEKLLKYIESNLSKEKGKWGSGLKNDYLAWCDLEDELKTFHEKNELSKELRLYEKFIKEKGLSKEFEQFKQK